MSTETVSGTGTGDRTAAMPAADASPRDGSAADVWDAQASVYDASRRSDPVYASCTREVVRAVPFGARRCLDAGCGSGLSSAKLAERCGLVVAVDYSFDSLAVLKRKAMPNVLLVQADLRALPFREGAFDACVSANTLQHLDPRGGQSAAIGELRRVTNAGGTISVSVHHYSRGKQKAGWIKEGRPGQRGIDYIFRFSLDDLRSALPDARIRAVGFYGLLRLPWLGGRLQAVAARGAGRLAALLGWGHMLIAVARGAGHRADR